MDIQLADAVSFDIFKQVDVKAPIIFITAYDDYALQAFKVNSVDYLLKPVKEEELKKAMEKFHRNRNAEPNVSQLMQWLQRNNQQQSYATRFLVQVGQQLKTIETTDAAYFYTQDKIVFINTKEGKRYAVDYHLDKLEHLLDPSKFFRINRQ